jgi:acetyl-CoA carboxylase biotin carboxyl carrier protein
MSDELRAEVTGIVWKIIVEVGDRIEAGKTVMILESMKMEIPILVEDPGAVLEILVNEGDSVVEGQPVAVIEE